MVGGSGYVEQELGLDNSSNGAIGAAADSATAAVEQAANSMNVRGVTLFFFLLYFFLVDSAFPSRYFAHLSRFLNSVQSLPSWFVLQLCIRF